jgi:hypothetical protein
MRFSSMSAAMAFTANDCIGSDLGSPVSLAYFDQAPFAFNGKIITTTISYPKKDEPQSLSASPDVGQ